jgi:hypothetical protein
MPELTTAEEYLDGVYLATTTMTSGTAKIQIATEDHTATDMTDASWTASATQKITIPDCTLNAVTTGDAQIFLKRIKNP